MVPYNDSSGNTSTTTSASFQSIMNCKQVCQGMPKMCQRGNTKQNKTKQSNRIKQTRGSRIVTTSQRGLGVSVGRAGPRCAGGSERSISPDRNSYAKGRAAAADIAIRPAKHQRPRTSLYLSSPVHPWPDQFMAAEIRTWLQRLLQQKTSRKSKEVTMGPAEEGQVMSQRVMRLNYFYVNGHLIFCIRYKFTNKDK